VNISPDIKNPFPEVGQKKRFSADAEMLFPDRKDDTAAVVGQNSRTAGYFDLVLSADGEYGESGKDILRNFAECRKDFVKFFRTFVLFVQGLHLRRIEID
jgi:hypothetical protein